MKIARWMGAAATAVVCATVMSACSSGAASTPDPRLYGTWHLVEAIKDGAPLPLNGSDITLAITDAEQTGGESMCAPYAATVIGGIGAVFVRVRNESTTRDACIPNALVNVGEKYLSALESSRFAAVSKGMLTLTSRKNSLLYVLTSPQVSPKLPGTSWTLYVSPQSKRMAAPTRRSEPVTLTFSSTDLMTIGSPCVDYSSQLQIDGGSDAANAFHEVDKDRAHCTELDRTDATEAAGALLGPMLITVSPAPTPSDPATLVITNANTSIPTVWTAKR
jgi:heat shock protein HslJ